MKAYELIVQMHPKASLAEVEYEETEEGGIVRTQAIATHPLGDDFRALHAMLYFRIMITEDAMHRDVLLRAVDHEVDSVVKDLGRYLASSEGREFADNMRPGISQMFAEVATIKGLTRPATA